MPIVVVVLNSLESDTFREYGNLSGILPAQEERDVRDRVFAAIKAQNNYVSQGADNAAKSPQFRQAENFSPLRFLNLFCKSFTRATGFIRYRINFQGKSRTLDSCHAATNTAIDLKLQPIHFEPERHFTRE